MCGLTTAYVLDHLRRLHRRNYLGAPYLPHPLSKNCPIPPPLYSSPMSDEINYMSLKSYNALRGCTPPYTWTGKNSLASKPLIRVTGSR